MLDLTDFQKATDRLVEVLELKETDIVRDSAIKRFEICFDLAWKAIKNYARDQGIECHSPRACLKEAFHLGLIGYEKKWLQMLEDRNSTAHMYAQEIAEQIYHRLKDYAELFDNLLTSLEVNSPQA